MYAVIKTGGKQYRVAPDDIIKVEKLAGSAGDKVEIANVLMVGGDGEPMIGTPLVDGATVSAELVEQTRAKKITVFKKKRRKNYRRKAGHRQDLTVLRITEITAGGKKAAATAAAKKPAAAAKEEDPKPVEAEEVKTAAAEAPAEGAMLFATPEGAADDLKKLSGVGPAIEKKLHALGITQFAQVAGFTASDIEKVDEVLNFKGRIEREDWVGQAKTIVEEASK